MKYLVTGCAGFIASRVCEMLLEDGHQVVGMDSLNDAYDVRLKHWRLGSLLGGDVTKQSDYRLTIGQAGKLRAKSRNFVFIKGDTSNRKDVERVFSEAQYDVVLNLAARAGVPSSVKDPTGFLKSNTEGVINVLEAMSRNNVCNHVLASTSSVYATPPGTTPTRSKEIDNTDHPRSPYAASKKAAELICHSFSIRPQNPISTTVVRYFTVYGPAGRPDMSIFRFIESALRGNKIEVTGDGHQSRDFTFVDDIARGTILASRSNNGFRVINLGGGKSPTSINDVIRLIESETGRKILKAKAAPAAGDMSTSMADISSAKRLLRWTPRTDLKDGIAQTVAWHRKHRNFAGVISMPGVATPPGEEIIGVIGLGYVGLPLAHALSGHFKVVGFDLNKRRVKELGRGIDSTKEVEQASLLQRLSSGLSVTTNPALLRKCTMIIVTVPTPVDDSNLPDLGPIKGASRTIGTQLRHMPKDVVVVYESTVYPGCTEEDCVPIIEQESGLRYGRDFHVGYSPERINPGDKEHTLDKITKVVAGDCQKTLARLTAVYAKVAKDIHQAESIKVAEAAKVIENTQRDLNIALVNELVVIFERLGIKTSDVLRAAATKWNFLDFKPGLVGGHCIGVDPYYLTNRAQRAGYHPEIILAGRRLNDSMPKLFADYLVKSCIRSGHQVAGRKVLVLGLTFKENIPDFRNSKSVDLIRGLEGYGMQVDAYDPNVDIKAFKSDKESKGLRVLERHPPRLTGYLAIVLAVAHKEFKTAEIIRCVAKAKKSGTKIFDLKNAWSDQTGLSDWAP